MDSHPTGAVQAQDIISGVRSRAESKQAFEGRARVGDLWQSCV
jgi:hypothetical protein